MAAIPPGWKIGRGLASGGVAELNHRLLAVTPAGVDMCTGPLHTIAPRVRIIDVSRAT